MHRDLSAPDTFENLLAAGGVQPKHRLVIKIQFLAPAHADVRAIVDEPDPLIGFPIDGDFLADRVNALLDNSKRDMLVDEMLALRFFDRSSNIGCVQIRMDIDHYPLQSAGHPAGVLEMIHTAVDF